jgi:hypothetical protein
MAKEVNMLPRHRGNLLEQLQKVLLLGGLTAVQQAWKARTAETFRRRDEKAERLEFALIKNGLASALSRRSQLP